jgi:hypothetical protein
MKNSLSAFETESQSITLPGYRWITFTVHKANQPLNATSARGVVEVLFLDPAFIDEYLNFALEHEVAHGPYLLDKISPENFMESPFLILPSSSGHPVKRYTARGEPWQDPQAR